MPFRRDPSSVPPPSASPAKPRVPAEADPNETMFFQRREKRRFHLLPFLVLAILVVGGAGLLGWAYLRSLKPASPLTPTTGATVADPSRGRTILTPAEARRAGERGTAVATPPPPPSPTPEPEVRRATAVNPDDPDAAPPNLDLRHGENAEVKREVLARVDLMPEVSQDNKDKLYAAVDRARGMGRVMTLPFDKGRLVVNRADVEKLQRRAASPDVKKFTDDPTVVFVVLGYADQKGDAKENYQLSLRRARSVLDALRDSCGFQNVMHAVGMGGSTMFSAQQVEKNRVAEVWAVLP